MADGLFHRGVAAVAGEAKHNELLATVESFVDACGKAARASELLHIHRGTLYYRLNRFCEVTGADLDDGDERLAVHLALKALRLHRSMATPAESRPDTE